MTNEQREAIENLSEINNLSEEELQKENENITAILDYTDLKSLDTVLSLIKEQEICIKKSNDTTEEMNRDITILINELKQKDKQIDLMAEHIHITGEYECPNIKCEDNGSITCEDCIKQYFANKVNSSEQN